jgi:hypothetical protein
MTQKLKELIYNERGLILTDIVLNSTKQNNPILISKFLFNLNNLGYSLVNIDSITNLTELQLQELETQVLGFLSSISKEGFLFRSSFASSDMLSDYSDEDWLAIFAQYSLTYDWENTFIEASSFNPKDYLFDYLKSNPPVKLKSNLKSIYLSFNSNDTIENLLSSIVESKIVLRPSQIDIINNCPIDFIPPLLKKNIVINETEVYLIQRLISDDIYSIENLSLDQIVKLTVLNYSSSKYSYIDEITQDTQINKFLLKNINIKYPTKIKKLFTRMINLHTNVPLAIDSMNKYYGFWKKIFTALRWESDSKAKVKFPFFFELKKYLYINDRSNFLHHKVEASKYEGDYLSAINYLSDNPGLLLRNLFEYIRYSTGTTIAHKLIDSSSFDNDCLSSNDTLKNISSNISTRSIIVKTDASSFFYSSKFKNILSNSNPKLLFQILALFDDDSLFTSRTSRLVQNTPVQYSSDRPLPALDLNMTNIVKKKIKKALKKIKNKDNLYLGSVFIDKDLKNHNIEFSGRSASLSLSGEYLSPGSKIPISSLLSNDKLLRIGIAWKGVESCDIDHALHILDSKDKSFNDRIVDFTNPTLSCNDDIIATSSGDVTFNDNNKFSTELIDIDISLARIHGIEKLLSLAIQYSGKSFSNYDVLWFFNVIDKKDRVIDSSNIFLNLDQMDYAIQVNKNSKNLLGFELDLINNEITVLNQVINNSNNDGTTVSSIQGNLVDSLNNKPKLTSIYKALKTSISKDQIVSSKSNADVIISSSKPLDSNRKNGVIYLSPSKDLEIINNIVF